MGSVWLGTLSYQRLQDAAGEWRGDSQYNLTVQLGDSSSPPRRIYRSGWATQCYPNGWPLTVIAVTCIDEKQWRADSDYPAGGYYRLRGVYVAFNVNGFSYWFSDSLPQDGRVDMEGSPRTNYVIRAAWATPGSHAQTLPIRCVPP